MEKIREKSSVIYVSVITSFITTFMGSALNLSVPALEKEFHVSAGTVSWVITIYMLTCASFAVPFGRLGDRVERRRILYMGILIFSISSAAAVFSAGIGFFLAARIMQGIGASMIFSTNIAILVGAFDEDMRGKVLGYSTCATYVGLSAGPVAGGILNYNFGWRSVFIATAIVSAVAFCVAVCADYGKEVGAGTCGVSAYWLNRTAGFCQGWRYLVYYETNIWISSGFSFE